MPAFDRSACASNAICYTYQGGGWYDAVMPLAVAYKMTGDTKYSNQLKAVLAVMTATNGNTLPLYADSGYPTRFVIPAFAIIFDWAYDQLTPAEKANAVSLANYWWSLYTSSPGSFYQSNCTAITCSSSNYATGHQVGFGLMGLALEGELVLTALRSTRP